MQVWFFVKGHTFIIYPSSSVHKSSDYCFLWCLRVSSSQFDRNLVWTKFLINDLEILCDTGAARGVIQNGNPNEAPDVLYFYYIMDLLQRVCRCADTRNRWTVYRFRRRGTRIKSPSNWQLDNFDVAWIIAVDNFDSLVI